MERLLKLWWLWPLLTVAMLVLALLAQLMSWMSPMAFVIVAVLLIALQLVLFAAAIGRRQKLRIIGILLTALLSVGCFCFYVGVVGVTKLVGMLMANDNLISVNTDGPHMEDVIGEWKTDEGATLVFNRDGSCFVADYNWVDPKVPDNDGSNYLMGAWTLTTETDTTEARVQVSIPSLEDVNISFSLQFIGRGLLRKDRPYDLFLNTGDVTNYVHNMMYREDANAQHRASYVGRVQWAGNDSLEVYDDQHITTDTVHHVVLLYQKRTLASYGPLHRPFLRINAAGHLMADTQEIDFTQGLPDSIGAPRRIYRFR